MLTINDLGRAAWEAEWLYMLGHGVKRPRYDQISRADQRMMNAGALAVAERFAEEVIDDIRKLKLAYARMFQDTHQFTQAIDVVEELLSSLKGGK